MAKGSKKGKTPNYVKINEELCNGCVLCMKVCPAQAIRVKDNKLARIEGECIDCGECIKACPHSRLIELSNIYKKEKIVQDQKNLKEKKLAEKK